MASINSYDPMTKIQDQEVFCDNTHYKISKNDYTPEITQQVELFNDKYVYELSPNNSFDEIKTFNDLRLLGGNMLRLAGKPIGEVTTITTRYGTELTVYGNHTCPEGFLLTHIKVSNIDNSCIKMCFSGEITSDTPILT